jgi:hypothetical protein
MGRDSYGISLCSHQRGVRTVRQDCTGGEWLKGKKKKKQWTPNGDGQIVVERRSNMIRYHGDYGEG